LSSEVRGHHQDGINTILLCPKLHRRWVSANRLLAACVSVLKWLRRGGQHVLYGSALALAAVLQAWYRHAGAPSSTWLASSSASRYDPGHHRLVLRRCLESAKTATLIPGDGRIREKIRGQTAAP